MTENEFIHGDPWGICDRCGLKYRRKDLRREWTGAVVCKADWEIRHPQLDVRGRNERVAVHDARPRSTDTFSTRAEYIILAPRGELWEPEPVYLGTDVDPRIRI